MKKFIKHTLLFSFIPLIFLMVTLFALLFQDKQDKKQYELAPGITTLFAGDSHMQKAINDTLLPGAKNIAAKAEAPYYTYYKLKHYLDANRQIKKIYLGFGYHSLSSYYDEFVNGEFSEVITLRYFYELPPEERMKCLLWNKDSFSVYIKNLLIKEKGEKINYSVGYNNGFTSTHADTTFMNKRLSYQFGSGEKIVPFSQYSSEYFGKIARLCKERKVELIVLNTPLHKFYRAKIPNEYIRKLRLLAEEYSIEVIDFGGIQFSDACFIPDGDHVSARGAGIVTKLLLNGTATPHVYLQF